MTEQEWLTSDDRWRMLQIVQQHSPSERKVRLFNAAVCRRFWNYLPEASQAILVESERIADGLVQASSDRNDLCSRANAVVAPFDRQYPDKQFPSSEIRIRRNAAAAVCYAVLPSDLYGAGSYFLEMEPSENGPHVALIRDVFGNPFRPVAVDPVWVTSTVRQLAQAIYDERAFDRLPIFADALEDAGCSDQAILSHCRRPGPHVRGCFVVDLLLGKE